MKKVKIINISDIQSISKKIKKLGKKIIHCHGVFDLLHLGHLTHFKEAASLGDVLFVSITPDKFVNKGPERPYFKNQQRLEALSAVKYIDYLILNNNKTSTNIIKHLKPDIYCKGPDYKNFKLDYSGQIDHEHDALKKYNGKLHITKQETFSSSKFINNSISKDPKGLFLKNIKREYEFNSIISIFKKFEKRKVLIIGETIIDHYVFCDVMGKSGKEPVLNFKVSSEKKYPGGSLAVANNMCNFSNKIFNFGMIGDNDNYGKFLEKRKNKKIKNIFIKKRNSPTIVKKKYIDKVSNNKVFATYQINDEIINKDEESKILSKLKKIIKRFDIIVVCDYGHGFITQNIAKYICKNSKFLIVNCQINSSNQGYHEISKYYNFDAAIINENELRYELRDKSEKIEKLSLRLVKKLKVKNLVVTRGSSGALVANSHNKFYSCPAFATKVVDKIGTGDAMMSMMAFCLKEKINLNLSLLIGSMAAAQSVNFFANSETISKMDLMRSLEYSLK